MMDMTDLQVFIAVVWISFVLFAMYFIEQMPELSLRSSTTFVAKKREHREEL